MEKFIISPQSSHVISNSMVNNNKPYSLNSLADSATNISNHSLNQYKPMSSPSFNSSITSTSNTNLMNHSSHFSMSSQQIQHNHHSANSNQPIHPNLNSSTNNPFLTKSPSLLYGSVSNTDYIFSKNNNTPNSNTPSPFSSSSNIPTVLGCNTTTNNNGGYSNPNQSHQQQFQSQHPHHHPHHIANQVPSMSPCASPQTTYKSLTNFTGSSHFSPSLTNSSMVPCLSKSRSNSIDSEILSQVGNSVHSTPVMPSLHISSSPMLHHGGSMVPPQVHLFNYSPSSSPTPYFGNGQICPTSPPFGLNPINGTNGPSQNSNSHHLSPLNSSSSSLSMLVSNNNNTNNNQNNFHSNFSMTMPSTVTSGAVSTSSDKSDDSSASTPPMIDSGAILECFIELRDLGSSVSKQSKESMVNGDFYNGLERIKQTLSTLNTKVESLDGSMQQIIQNGGDSRVFGNNDEGRVPVLTRPRRFRKSKVKNKELSSENLLDPSKNKRKATELKNCTSCGTTSSPEWRKGPAGNQSLCNACGLYFAKLLRREATLAWKPQSVVKVDDLLCAGNNSNNQTVDPNNPNNQSQSGK